MWHDSWAHPQRLSWKDRDYHLPFWFLEIRLSLRLSLFASDQPPKQPVVVAPCSRHFSCWAPRSCLSVQILFWWYSWWEIKLWIFGPRRDKKRKSPKGLSSVFGERWGDGKRVDFSNKNKIGTWLGEAHKGTSFQAREREKLCMKKGEEEERDTQMLRLIRLSAVLVE